MSYFNSILILILLFSTFNRNTLWADEMSIWHNALTKSPLKARTHNGVGMAYSSRGLVDPASSHFKKATTLQPDFYIAYNNLGAEQFRMLRFDEAKESFLKALSYEFNYAEAHNNLGSALALLGDIDGAIAEFLIAQKQSPHYIEPVLNLARAYIVKGDKAKAELYLNKSTDLGLDPDTINKLKSMISPQ